KFSARNSVAFNVLFSLMLSKNCQRLRIVLLLNLTEEITPTYPTKANYLIHPVR
ncbi:hypothetical protein GLN32_06670, partial [Shigella flexneri 2a]|nr:hypothetical protein [Shigella flexneri 2a]